MRADRLIALLLLLQQRERITAAEAAAELEVSERTARRDLEALAISGVPLYSTAGRGGGWQLIGGARTDLTGLSADEARALFLAAGPSLAATPELRSAMAKLTTALPEPFRSSATSAATAIRIDPAGWGRTARTEPLAHLDALVRAVVDGRQVDVDYDSARRTKGRRVLHPLGLVSKRTTWYLVARPDRPVPPAGPEPNRSTVRADDAVRAYRVDRIRDVVALDAPVRRPPGFDLDRAWERIAADVEALRAGIEVRAWVRADVMTAVRWQFGAQCTPIDDPGRPAPGPTRGWIAVRLTEGGPASMAAMLAGFGAAIDVVDPPALLAAELSRIARELAERYPAKR